MPAVLNDKLPALQAEASSRTVDNNLNLMHRAHEPFINPIQYGLF